MRFIIKSNRNVDVRKLAILKLLAVFKWLKSLIVDMKDDAYKFNEESSYTFFCKNVLKGKTLKKNL